MPRHDALLSSAVKPSMNTFHSAPGPKRPGPRTMTDLSPACRKTTDRLTDYLEGVLDDRDRQSLEHHLATCPACSNTLQELRTTVSLLNCLKFPRDKG